MKETDNMIMKVTGWSANDLFWYKVDLAREYLVKYEQLKESDAKMLMGYAGFWAWWNTLLENAFDLFLVIPVTHIDHNALTLMNHMQEWLNESNIHSSFWDANYETMIKKVIRKEVMA